MTEASRPTSFNEILLKQRGAVKANEVQTELTHSNRATLRVILLKLRSDSQSIIIISVSYEISTSENDISKSRIMYQGSQLPCNPFAWLNISCGSLSVNHRSRSDNPQDKKCKKSHGRSGKWAVKPFMLSSRTSQVLMFPANFLSCS